MKKIIKEPLFQFLLIGAGLFLLYTLVNPKQRKEEIVVDSYLLNDLTTKWKMNWNREPGLQELKGLIDLYIEQEVLYREALAMNLDHNDEIIKRRLAKKMEFISDDLAESLQPTENLLQEYYEKNKRDYPKPSVFTLKQVFFNEDKRVSAIKDATEALQLEQIENSGDRISLPSQYENTNATKIAIDFGSGFATALDTLPLGRWTGPVRSGLGVHLVYVEDRIPSGFYPFEEVADRVRIDYNFHASNDFKRELIVSLLENYKVRFELDDIELNKELSENF